MDRVIRTPCLSLEEGAVDPWTKPQYEWNGTHFRKSMRGKVRWNVPFGDLTPDEKALVHQAIQSFFEEVEAKKYKVHVREFLSRYRGYERCAACKGSRLHAEALNVRAGATTQRHRVRQNIPTAY